jgi:hypothetical protein
MPFWAPPCGHWEMTAPDENGVAICVKCGTAIVGQILTRDLLVEAFERVRRDHGSYGAHSMACVDTPDGWCCATDCTMGRGR